MNARFTLRTLAAAAALASTSQAFALSPTQMGQPDVVTVYMSGASALRNIIGGLFTQNCVKDANGNTTDLDVYFSGIGTYGGVAFTANGDAHRVYSCTMANESPILPGKKVALFKSDIGGSGQGVFPVFFGSIAPFPTRSFLAVTNANCPTRVATIPNYTCGTAETQQVPMVGVSDVEPGLFKGAGINVPEDDPTYPQDGLTPDQLAGLNVTTLFQVVFGTAVNKALRDEMQAAQGLPVGSEAEADQPSISRGQLRSLFTGVLSDPGAGLGWQSLVRSTDPKRNTRVNVCRRVPGSGTQAAANAFIAEFPCNSGAALTPARFDFSDAGLSNAVGSVGPSGNIFVFEGSTTGNVISCINQAETAGAYAIGHVSRENAPGTGNWRHIKIDGVMPSRDNTKTGRWDYYYEPTIQYANDRFAGLSADQQNFITQFTAQAQKPTSLQLLSSAAQNGVTALPSSYAGAFGTGTAAEQTFGSRVSRGGNSCTPSVFFK